MKKILALGLVCVSALSMTSCLEGGSNETSGSTAGVIEYNAKVGKNVVYYSDYEFLYVPTVASDMSIMNGDCCMLGYNINYDSPENVGAYEKGYYTATGTAYAKIDNYTLTPHLTDTATLMTAESAISNLDNTSPNMNWGLIRNNLFINTYHKDVLTDMKSEFNLSYDINAEPVEVDEKRVYNLYLRMIVTDEGKSPTQNLQNINAFDIEYFMMQTIQREKSAGNDAVHFRLNYINEIEKETLNKKWFTTEPYTYMIPKEENN